MITIQIIDVFLALKWRDQLSPEGQRKLSRKDAIIMGSG